MSAGIVVCQQGPSKYVPATCSGAQWVKRDYWMGEARLVHGPDMALCEAHGRFLNRVNPFGILAEPGKPRKVRRVGGAA